MPWETVPTVGISKITAVDFEYASILKSTIKLVGTACRNSDGTVAVYVSPVVVPLNSPLASAKGPGNMVVVTRYLRNYCDNNNTTTHGNC